MLLTKPLCYVVVFPCLSGWVSLDECLRGRAAVGAAVGVAVGGEESPLSRDASSVLLFALNVALQV
jgi:hypothetical protein